MRIFAFATITSCEFGLCALARVARGTGDKCARCAGTWHLTALLDVELSTIWA